MDADGATVLLVGDNARHASALEDYLLKRGCDIYWATCKNEAIELFQRRRFDLVLSEFMLSDGTAYELMVPLLGSRTIMFFSHAVEDSCWWMTGVFEGQDCSEQPGMRPAEFGMRLNEILNSRLFRSSNHPSDSFPDQRKDVPAGFGSQPPVGTRRHAATSGSVRASGASGNVGS